MFKMLALWPTTYALGCSPWPNVDFQLQISPEKCAWHFFLKMSRKFDTQSLEAKDYENNRNPQFWMIQNSLLKKSGSLVKAYSFPGLCLYFPAAKCPLTEITNPHETWGKKTHSKRPWIGFFRNDLYIYILWGSKATIFYKVRLGIPSETPLILSWGLATSSKFEVYHF